ncbi:prepilin peptidase [Stieleria varia]|uniref:Type IV leader peptidase family protein n=1 Tax=Stieleria varia TaxID=2528005 RepID=A0A5C6A6M1_9BACT|nr:prepilin peptidase [Stieleria varia]TWT94721.1 Type IV leader peptidase family protein [Stieleria varia]
MLPVIASIVLLLLATATVCDLRTREIPDWISVAIGVIAVVVSLMGWWDLEILWVIVGGLLGLLVGLGLFRFAHLGGGDAKLIISLGLLVGPVGLLIVLFGMAIAGGVLSVIAMVRGQKDLAYGPAILAGFVGYLGLVSQI